MAHDGSDGYDGGATRDDGGGEDRGLVEEPRTTWAEETRRYRREPGGWWWLALLGIPVLLAALSLALGSGDDPESDPTPTTTTTSTTRASVTTTSPAATAATTPAETATAAAAAATATIASAPFAVLRDGDAVTVRADVASAKDKDALIQSVKEAVGVDRVLDKVTVIAGVEGPSPQALTTALTAMKSAGDFGLAWDLTSVVATGAVDAEPAKAAAGQAISAAWPGSEIRNGINVGGDNTVGCTNLGDQISVALADTKITFGRYGTDLDAESVSVLKRVASMAGGCSDARLTVTGHTDASGSESENKRLSEERATSVRTVLLESGLAAEQVTATGKGEANPIASNQTPAGIAANRRVEITVS